MTWLAFPGPGAEAPRPTLLSAPYWEGCARGELLFQRCTACGRAAGVASWACRWCGREALEWQSSAGRGTLCSWSVVWRPRSADLHVPYAVVIAEMDEGFALLSNLGECDTDDLALGVRLKAVFRRLSERVGLPLFVLDGAGGPG